MKDVILVDIDNMERPKQSLDSWDILPNDMITYLRNYGRHFNKKMYEYAVSNMYKINRTTNIKERMTPITRDRFETLLRRYNVILNNDVLYDGMYVMTMAMADFFGSSIQNEQQLVLFVKDYIDDPDQVDGFVFNRFYSDMVLAGNPIEWSDML